MADIPTQNGLQEPKQAPLQASGTSADPYASTRMEILARSGVSDCEDCGYYDWAFCSITRNGQDIARVSQDGHLGSDNMPDGVSQDDYPAIASYLLREAGIRVIFGRRFFLAEKTRASGETIRAAYLSRHGVVILDQQPVETFIDMAALLADVLRRLGHETTLSIQHFPYIARSTNYDADDDDSEQYGADEEDTGESTDIEGADDLRDDDDTFDESEIMAGHLLTRLDNRYARRSKRA